MGKRLQNARLQKQNFAIGSSEHTPVPGMEKGLKRLRPWLDSANLDVDVVVASQPQVSQMEGEQATFILTIIQQGPSQLSHGTLSNEDSGDATGSHTALV